MPETTANFQHIPMNDAGKYVRIVTKDFGKGIKARLGFKEDGTSEVQSLMFDTGKYTMTEAKKWVSEHKNSLMGQLIDTPDLSKAYDLEMMGEIRSTDVTNEDVARYGLDGSTIDRNNFHLIELELMLLDKPCSPVIEGSLKESGIREFVFDSGKAENYLNSLKNKPIHVNSALDGHYEVGDNNTRSQTVVGSFLGGRIDVNNDGDKVVKCLAGLFDKSKPAEVGDILARKSILGTSFELTPTDLEINAGSTIAKVKEWIYKGAAILQKQFAAFPETSILLAQYSGQELIEKKTDMKGAKKMAEEKTYNQSDLDTLLFSAKASWLAEVAESEETKKKEKDMSDLKAALAEKDTVITTLNTKVSELDGKIKDSEMTAKLNTWWTENEKLYPAEKKDVLLAARRAVLEGKASVEQTDTLIAMKQGEATEKPTETELVGSISDEGVLVDGKNVDIVHGIRVKKGFVRK